MTAIKMKKNRSQLGGRQVKRFRLEVIGLL